MSRRRMIKPEFFTDEKVINLPIPARLLFIGMWNHADDEGIFKDSPIQLKVQVFPADESIDLNTIKTYIDLMINQKLLIPGTNVDNSKLLRVTKWSDHQTINRPTASKYIFTPISDDSVSNQLPLNEDSVSNHTQLTDDSLPNKDKLNKDKIKEVKESKVKTKVKENSAMSKTDKIKAEFTFDRFYQLYPRKIREQMALNAFKVIAAKHLEAVFRGLENYNIYWKNNNVDVEFIPYPSTWLNQKQWNDVLDLSVKQPKFKDSNDEQIFHRNENIALESKRMRRHLEQADKDAIDEVPDLTVEMSKLKKDKSNAQPISDVVASYMAQAQPNTDSDG